MKKLITAITVTCALMFTTAYADEPDLVPVVEPEVTIEEVSKGMTVENPDLGLSMMTRLTSEAAYMSMYAGLNVSDTVKMWKDVMYLKDNTDVRKVVMFLNSPGGSAFDGIAMARWIDSFQKDLGFTFEVQASGIVASAAVPIYAVCKVRKVLKGTVFMVHEAAIFKWPGRETASDIKSQNRMMEIIGNMYIDILVENSTLTRKEWKEREGSTTWFTKEEAREWGLIER